MRKIKEVEASCILSGEGADGDQQNTSWQPNLHGMGNSIKLLQGFVHLDDTYQFLNMLHSSAKGARACRRRRRFGESSRH